MTSVTRESRDNGASPLRVGDSVPNFEMTIYDPVKEDFGTLSLDFLKSQKLWSILFFYPADFTFV